MFSRLNLAAVFCAWLCISVIHINAEARSYSYGVYEGGEWSTKYGDVPAPPLKFQVPTGNPDLNDFDKQYLCELVKLSATECKSVRFTNGPAGFNAEAGVVQFIWDIGMSYNGKQCSGSVWKTRKKDDTWLLSSPTAVFGFPHTCTIPEARSNKSAF